MRICFFANVPLTEILKIEFYFNDLRILRELGHEVVVVESVRELLNVSAVEMYYVWWWNRALAPVALAKLRGAKVIVCGVFDYFLPYSTKHDYVSRPFWQRALMRTALKYSDANIFICTYEFELVQRFFPITNPCMIYLAIDIDRYQQKTSPAKKNRLLNIAWSGDENARRKGLFELIRAMPIILAAHPDARLVMAGRPGPALSALKELSKALQVAGSVEFPGELTLEQKVLEMQKAALYVQPSMYEGFGSAVAEAMACGTPAACTLTGSLPEVIGTEGEPISQPTPKCIAESVGRFLSLDEREQERRGIQCAERVHRMFSYEARRDAIARVISQLRPPTHN